ncbi:serine/threonine-protein kinase [Polyangium sp. 15x6]|uniref:serine/threonine-protein kinase n=1 Tax=Polyangium sp. 15x6 TaxID=3042687 RepID=UPI00249CC46B|nr:serine/threonine-protein kinase [Polyangium sp. 15x6]MDI3290717.1 serine/threonine-protein kinase [Polyangium sp. 15x6]
MNSRYRILRPLASGGFGRVSLALDQETGEQVAVKELIELRGDALDRFRNEYAILYDQIDNKYVVDVLDADFDAHPPYIVLEYCEHGSLRSWVEQPKPWLVVAFALSYALQGLWGIHRLGGFHRDLKPENLLVTSDPDMGFIVKVADFGLARVPQGTTTMTNHKAGTRGYIAPEVDNGSVGFHAGADIYSLGVVATELLTGTGDPARLNNATIPAALRELVLQMIAADRTKRPDLHQIASRLAEIVKIGPVQASASPAPEAVSQRAAAPPRAVQPAAPAAVAARAPSANVPSVSVPAPAAATSGPGLGATLLAGGMAAGLVAALLTKLASNDTEWDESVRRYRGSDGRFEKGKRRRR